MDTHYIYVMEAGAELDTTPTAERLKELGIRVIATDLVHAGGTMVSYYLVAECRGLESAMNVHRLLEAAGPGGEVVPAGLRLNTPSKYPER